MGATTAQRLREAAEDLLIERGHRTTTLRDITSRAGANVAAVGYHFGSKDALLAEVFRTALEEVTDVQRRHLDALPPDADLEQVVRVWLAPVLHSPGTDPRQERLWQLVTRGMAEGAPQLREHVDAVKEIVDRHLVERLAAALPQLDRHELLVRHALALRSVAGLGAAGPVALIPDGTDVADLVVAWVVGGLRAPAAGAPHPAPPPTDPSVPTVP